MKFRCLIECEIIDVDAPTEYDAQLLAFATLVRNLSPSHFTCWPTSKDDEWRQEEAK